jgi:hypothetical protein
MWAGLLSRFEPWRVYAQTMCEVKLSPTSGWAHADEAWASPVCENRATGDAAMRCYLRAPSQYRVLRLLPRGSGRSVDRDCAGRNATSVKDVEPRQSAHSVVAEHVSTTSESSVSEGNISREAGTTGVQDHGMYRRSMAEHLRSASGGVEAKRPWPQTEGQGLRPESEVIPGAEVRCLHSSDEAGQLPWSEGRYGE